MTIKLDYIFMYVHYINTINNQFNPLLNDNFHPVISPSNNSHIAKYKQLLEGYSKEGSTPVLYGYPFLRPTLMLSFPSGSTMNVYGFGFRTTQVPLPLSQKKRT